MRLIDQGLAIDAKDHRGIMFSLCLPISQIGCRAIGKLTSLELASLWLNTRIVMASLVHVPDIGKQYPGTLVGRPSENVGKILPCT